MIAPARRSLALLAALCALAAAEVRADDREGLISGPFEQPPRLEMRRTETPPKIDGRLTDEVWRGAPGFTGFRTTDPVPDGTPTEETTVRLLYDTHFLYVGVRCFDHEPHKIIATAQTQDDFMLQDDVIGIFIDTFGEGRSGYSFATNPLGNRYEALIEANRVELEWDGIWYVRTRIDELGWTAELKIPFKTLSFDPNGRDWGFQMVREVRRKNEKQRLIYANPGRRNFDLAALPQLSGMRGMDQGRGITIKPSLALKNRRERQRQTHLGERPGRRRYSSGTPSLDAFYRVTPALTGALTFNTDFSEAPVDTRQLNLTRFAAFFPEQRAFFLEDAGIFDFGGLSKESGLSSRDNPIPLSVSLNGMPFFSRSIGIGPDGENVDLLGGAKLTGRVGHVNVGLLTVRMDSHGVYDPVDTLPPPDPQHNELDDKQLSVARLSLNVLEESRIGLIATHGDPAFNRDASTLGADFNYRSSRIFGDRVLLGNLWYIDTGRTALGRHDSERGGLTGTDVPETGARDAAFGMRIDYPNDLVNWRLTAKQIGPNYRPAMGFIDRTGVREYTSVFRHRTRTRAGPDGKKGPVKYFDVGWDALLVTGVDDHLQSSELGLRLLEIANNFDDKLTLRWIASKENLDDFFPIFPGVDIPPGGYQFTRGEIALTAKDVHALSGRILTSYGEFYSGRRLETDIRLVWRPSRHFQFETDWTQSDVRLPSQVRVDINSVVPVGNFTSRVLRGRALIMFNTRVYWDTVVQYDNITDSVGINSRLRWELQPGNELFLVFNHGFTPERRTDCSTLTPALGECINESHLRSASSELIGKVEWTFRF